MKIQTKYLLIAILALLLLVLGVGYIIGHRRGESASKPQIHALNEEINRYSVELENIKTYVTEKEQELTTIKEALKNAELSKEEIRKLHLKGLQEITRLKFTIDTLMKNVSNSGNIIYVPVEGSQQPCVLLPFTFSKNDQWLDLYGVFRSKDSLQIGLKMRINATIYSEFNKKEGKYLVTVATTNPYLKTTELASQKFDAVKQKKWGIGVSAGYGITSAFKPSPFIGIGLNYNVIEF